MNLHPLIVHFPIAFLTLYAVLELISVRRLARKQYWFYLKAMLIVLGALGALTAYLSGNVVSAGLETIPLALMHERFATAVLGVSTFVALVYISALFGWNKLQILAWNFLSNRGAMIPLALVVLILITITGGLGGAMVYGTEFDPFMAPVFHILGL